MLATQKPPSDPPPQAPIPSLASKTLPAAESSNRRRQNITIAVRVTAGRGMPGGDTEAACMHACMQCMATPALTNYL